MGETLPNQARALSPAAVLIGCPNAVYLLGSALGLLIASLILLALGVPW